MKLPTRSECIRGPRPCPHRTCRMHMDGPESCAQDVADRGEHKLKEVAAILGVRWQSIQKAEQSALRKIERNPRAARIWADYLEQRAARRGDAPPPAQLEHGEARELRQAIEAHVARHGTEAAE